MARIDVGIRNFPLIHRHFQTEAFLAFRIVRSKILPVQPTKLETLDDLLAQAEHYAGFCMRNKRKDVAHAFPDRRRRAAHVRPDFTGGCQRERQFRHDRPAGVHRPRRPGASTHEPRHESYEQGGRN